MKQQIRMFVTKRLSLLFLALAVSIVTTGAFNNQNNSDPDSLDPGVRGGTPAAGGPQASLSSDYHADVYRLAAPFPGSGFSIRAPYLDEDGTGLGPGL